MRKKTRALVQLLFGFKLVFSRLRMGGARALKLQVSYQCNSQSKIQLLSFLYWMSINIIKRCFCSPGWPLRRSRRSLRGHCSLRLPATIHKMQRPPRSRPRLTLTFPQLLHLRLVMSRIHVFAASGSRSRHSNIIARAFHVSHPRHLAQS